LFKPLALMSLVLLAISFVFGSVRQVSMAQRVFLGVLVGISFHIFQDIAGTSSLVFGFSPLSGVLFPLLTCAFAGLVLLNRVR
jgi:lipopolysaccharide export system permease protein